MQYKFSSTVYKILPLKLFYKCYIFWVTYICAVYESHAVISVHLSFKWLESNYMVTNSFNNSWLTLLNNGRPGRTEEISFEAGKNWVLRSLHLCDSWKRFMPIKNIKLTVAAEGHKDELLKS